MDYLPSLAAWAEAHPMLMAAIVWPFVTGLITLLLKPRTPEAYATIAGWRPTWLFARFAASLQLLGALGLDPVKVIKVLRKVAAPPKGVGPAVVLVAVLALSSTGCVKGWQVASLLADKIQCAVASQDLPDAEIVKRCAIDPSDIPRVMEIVGTSRQEGANEAVGAANRQAEADHRTGICH